MVPIRYSVSLLTVLALPPMQPPGEGTRAQANLIELRIARRTPAPGFVLKRSVTDSSFYVQPRVVISDSDVKSAHTAQSTNGLALTIQLSADGASRLNAATKAHVRQRLAVVIQGRLNSAPVIAHAMNLHEDQPITVAVQLTDNDAKQFAALIAARWRSTP